MRSTLRFYFQVQAPALAGRPYSGAMTDFTDRAILAYECGYNEADLAVQMEHALMAGRSGPVRDLASADLKRLSTHCLF